jgi:hypothetical protein
MERTEREQERGSWAGFQIRTSSPGRNCLLHSYGQILRTSSPVVKRKIIAKLIERANCRSRAGGASTLGGTGTWRVGPGVRGLGLPSRHAPPQVVTAAAQAGERKIMMPRGGTTPDGNHRDTSDFGTPVESIGLQKPEFRRALPPPGA